MKKESKFARYKRKTDCQTHRRFQYGQRRGGSHLPALEEKAQIVGIDDRVGMDACKLLGLPFTTAIGLLIRSRQKGLIGLDDARFRLSALARYGRYRKSILDDALKRLEATP